MINNCVLALNKMCTVCECIKNDQHVFRLKV